MVRVILPTCAILALVACQTPKAGFCSTAKPIRLTEATVDQMTDAEVERVLAHNELGRKLCRWQP